MKTAGVGSPLPCGSGNWTQIFRLGSKCLYPVSHLISHLTGPRHLFEVNVVHMEEIYTYIYMMIFIFSLKRVRVRAPFLHIPDNINISFLSFFHWDFSFLILRVNWFLFFWEAGYEDDLELWSCNLPASTFRVLGPHLVLEIEPRASCCFDKHSITELWS